MAIILCPECKKEVSDNAASCPHCGYQLKETEKEGCGIPILLGLILLAILFAIWIMIAGA